MPFGTRNQQPRPFKLSAMFSMVYNVEFMNPIKFYAFQWQIKPIIS